MQFTKATVSPIKDIFQEKVAMFLMIKDIISVMEQEVVIMSTRVILMQVPVPQLY